MDDLDYYDCEECEKVFDEFEMNFKAVQKDKKILCRKCRKQLEGTPRTRWAKKEGKINVG